MNRLIRQETLDIDGNAVVEYIYTLGAAGERLKVEELDRTVEYTYDDLYRLTSETITEGEKVTTYTYAYDNVSNRILKLIVVSSNSLDLDTQIPQTSRLWDFAFVLARHFKPICVQIVCS